MENAALRKKVGELGEEREILRNAAKRPAGVFVSGLVYDVATGLIDVVVPPARVEA
ncbi:hypothetical protein [Streptomyces sp. NPDC048295]|uniref:hypothetical protein n=1 Tax=Streptomyces sp. NPDC048295 TaxID=3154617 RepID=UPI003419ED8A